MKACDSMCESMCPCCCAQFIKLPEIKKLLRTEAYNVKSCAKLDPVNLYNTAYWETSLIYSEELMTIKQ